MNRRRCNKVLIYFIAVIMIFTGSISISFAAESSQVTSLAKPQNLYVCGNGKDTINVTWDKVSGATAYEVYRAKRNSFVDESDFKVVKTVTTNKYADKKVELGDRKIYYYRIKPVYESENTRIEGPCTHAQPGIVKLNGSTVNAFPTIEFKLLTQKTTAPGVVKIKVKVKGLNKKLIPDLRHIELTCDDYDYSNAYIEIPSGKSSFEKTGQMHISGDTNLKLDERYLNGEREIFRMTLEFLYKSSLGKRSGLTIQYPVWSYDVDNTFEIVEEYDNVAFRAWLTDKNITSRIKKMKDGKIAFLKIGGNWNPNGIVKKSYLDAIKGTNKVIVARVITTGGDTCDWIFYGNKIKSTKNIRIGYMTYTDFTDSGKEIHAFGFYKNGSMPAGTVIKMDKYGFMESNEGAYNKWVNSLVNNGYNRITFDNSTDTKIRIKVPGEATIKNGWIYFTIDPQYSIKNQTVTLSSKNFAYNGKNRKPAVTVKKNNRKLLKGTDYTITYPSSSKKIGRYKITVTGKSLFKGTKTIYYTVGPKATSKVIANVKGNNLNVKWNKVKDATGYAVYYKKAVNSNYKLAGHTTKLSYTVKNITGTGKYNIKVTPYKTVNKNKCYGGNKIISITK